MHRVRSVVAWGCGGLAMSAWSCSDDSEAIVAISSSDGGKESGVEASLPSHQDGGVVVFDAGFADASSAELSSDGGNSLFSCVNDTAFPSLLGVPEASAAAEVELLPGVRELLVVSDSGRGGVARLIAIPSGTQRAITLPLDTIAASDDLEGIAWRSGSLYTLTSSGAVRRFVPNGSGGLSRVEDAYALGPSPSACTNLGGINCGRNYEGLCLRKSGTGKPCEGYAASKAESKLYCVAFDASGRLIAVPSVPPVRLQLTLGVDMPAEHLSDCAFGAASGPAEDVLVVTTNVYGLSRTYRVDESIGGLTLLPTQPLLNVEAAAIDRDGALYTLDDNSTETSGAAKSACVGW
jgi:hypothetical protein